ncbi:phasin family protein [Hymenobacter sp. DG25A]|uniref:phasin family protein n=1 Tax=Hymenobacter sp. DG25A TaxID=1385663 RepID=UPI0006C8888F|nr:hypothetical protein [Hymenobacter sp. DG25A]
MEDLFKKFINAGVGFVSLTSDRVQSTIDMLVKESKLSEKEGEKIMEELRKNTDTKRKELEKQFNSITSRMMKSVGLATSSEVEELKRTVKGGSKSSTSGSKSGAAAKPAAKAAGASRTAGAAKSPAAKSGSSSASKAAPKASASKAGGAAKSAPKSAPKASDSTGSSAS